jgi:hypothetical protein
VGILVSLGTAKRHRSLPVVVSLREIIPASQRKASVFPSGEKATDETRSGMAN